MFCPNCGNHLPDGSAFCPDCGTNLNQANANYANQVNNANQANQNSYANQANNANQINYSNQPNPMNMGGMYRQPNPNGIGKLLKDSFENAKNFITAPKKYIKGFFTSENQNMPFVFLICEVVMALLFSFIFAISAEGMMRHYAMISLGSYADFDNITKMNMQLKTVFDGIWFTVFLWSFIAIVIVWLCRFIISKMIATPTNQNKAFNLLSVFSTIHIIQWVLNIIYVLIFFNSVKFNPSEFSSFSYSSSNPLEQLNAWQSTLDKFNGIIFFSVMFFVIAILLYTFDVIVLKRATDELEKNDGLPARKATIIIIVFAIILILINNCSPIILTKNVIEKMMTNAAMLVRW